MGVVAARWVPVEVREWKRETEYGMQAIRRTETGFWLHANDRVWKCSSLDAAKDRARRIVLKARKSSSVNEGQKTGGNKDG